MADDPILTFDYGYVIVGSTYGLVDLNGSYDVRASFVHPELGDQYRLTAQLGFVVARETSDSKGKSTFDLGVGSSFPLGSAKRKRVCRPQF